MAKQSFASHKLLPLHPLLQNSSNLQTILLHEHHMSISMDADIRQLEMLRRDACLLQELDCAPVIRRVVRRFGRHEQDGHLGEIDELSRWGESAWSTQSEYSDELEGITCFTKSAGSATAGE